jgi:hypothetical protein
MPCVPRAPRPPQGGRAALLAGTLALLLSPVALARAEDPFPDAARLLAKGEAEAAVALLEPLVEGSPDDHAAWLLLGRARRATGDADGALTALGRAADAPTTAPAACLEAARVEAERGGTAPALAWLERARAAGWRDRALALSDEALAPLREAPGFARVLPTALCCEEAVGPGARVLRTHVGEVDGERLGLVALGCGDLDGDGVPDYALAAPHRDTDGALAGRISAFSGASGAPLWSRSGSPGSRMGSAAALVPDVNGDGRSELLVGAPSWRNASGRAYLFSGADGKTLFTMHAGENGDQFGAAVASIGDIDDDGRPELAVGAPGAAGGAGRVTVYDSGGRKLFEVEHEGSSAFGRALAGHAFPKFRTLAVGAAGEDGRGRVYVLALARTSATVSTVLEASPTSRELGRGFLSFDLDLDRDRVPDLWLPDWADAESGRRAGGGRVLSGRTWQPLRAYTGRAAGEGFGSSRAPVGDVNGDGVPDLLAGAWWHGGGARRGGAAYLLSGSDGTELSRWVGMEPGDHLGWSAALVGDLDGDGAPELLLPAPLSAAGRREAGRVFVVSTAP